MQLTTISVKSPLAPANRYALTRMERLRPYRDHGIVELDNNAAERGMRAIALGRKNYPFVESEAGGKAAAIAYPLIETAKLNSIDPDAWLADTLARIPDYKITRVDDLLPWRWNGYDALLTIRDKQAATPPAVTRAFEVHSADLGFGLLLKRYVDDPRTATEAQIAMAAADTVPTVWPLFRAFRVMAGLGFSFIGAMIYFFYRASFKRMNFPRPALHLAVWMIPAPWIAADMGWFVAKFGRQPWTVDCPRPCRCPHCR